MFLWLAAEKILSSYIHKLSVDRVSILENLSMTRHGGQTEAYPKRVTAECHVERDQKYPLVVSTGHEPTSEAFPEGAVLAGKGPFQAGLQQGSEPPKEFV